MKKSQTPQSSGGPARGPEAEALHLLARRPLTVAELRERLQRRGHAGAAISQTIDRLGEAGYVDDLRLATDFIVTRAARLGHGRERLLRDLRRRGVDAAVAAEAWSRAVQDGDVQPEDQLRERVRREVERLGSLGGQLDPKAYRRVYNAQLRAGFDAERLGAELRPYCQFLDEA